MTSPTYSIGSVDSALRLLLMLADEGEMRVVDAALELGVARSTAHRMMQMLVRYGFATQTAHGRSYRAGPAWEVAGSREGELRLGLAAHPALAALAHETGETALLLALRPTGHAVAIAAAEGSNMVRAAARVGQRFPAHLTAGGRILLGALEPAARRNRLASSLRLAQLDRNSSAPADAVPSADTVPSAALIDAIDRAATDGYAVQHDEYEHGTGAVGVLVRIDELTSYSVDIVVPSSRLLPADVARLVASARSAASAISTALSTSQHPPALG